MNLILTQIPVGVKLQTTGPAAVTSIVECELSALRHYAFSTRWHTILAIAQLGGIPCTVAPVAMHVGGACGVRKYGISGEPVSETETEVGIERNS